MIGQDKLLERIYQYNLDSFPHSVILLGGRGSGRHSIAEEISKHLNIERVDIKTSISYEDIEQFVTRPQPYLYLFDASILSIKQQNVILKFLEEPLKNCYIVIVCETKQQLLDTILNRCQIWNLETYSKELLKEMFPQAADSQLELSDTPGQLIELLNIDVSGISYMYELANKIIYSISRAGVANTLSVADRFYYGKSKEKDKLNFDIFLKILLCSIRKAIVENNSSILYNMYYATSVLYNQTFIPNINKRQLFENYLMKLKLGA